jgi:hypothetical protein
VDLAMLSVLVKEMRALETIRYEEQPHGNAVAASPAAS